MPLKVKKLPWYLSGKGLLGTKKANSIYFQTRFGIHTFGMHYPIDVVILDNQYCVRVTKQKLKPNTFFFWNPLFQHVIELPEGAVTKLKIEKNQKLHLQTL